MDCRDRASVTIQPAEMSLVVRESHSLIEGNVPNIYRVDELGNVLMVSCLWITN